MKCLKLKFWSSSLLALSALSASAIGIVSCGTNKHKKPSPVVYTWADFSQKALAEKPLNIIKNQIPVTWDLVKDNIYEVLTPVITKNTSITRIFGDVDRSQKISLTNTFDSAEKYDVDEWKGSADNPSFWAFGPFIASASNELTITNSDRGGVFGIIEAQWSNAKFNPSKYVQDKSGTTIVNEIKDYSFSNSTTGGGSLKVKVGLQQHNSAQGGNGKIEYFQLNIFYSQTLQTKYDIKTWNVKNT